MACPFAKVASALGIEPGSAEAKAAFAASPYHTSAASKSAAPTSNEEAPSVSSTALSATSLRKLKLAAVAASSTVKTSATHSRTPTDAPLSQHLSIGTAAAHRQIESSDGVKALMSSLTKGNKELALGRLDYIKWLVMIDAIYSIMELLLLRLQDSFNDIPERYGIVASTIISDFLRSPTLLPALARRQTIADDIDAHVAALEDETAVKFEDHIEAEAEQHSAHWQRDSFSKNELLQILESFKDESSHRPRLLDLLSPRQVEATLAFVKRMLEVSQPDSSSTGAGVGLLTAHAYTRYMGDLSGGQFIKKHVQARWPCFDEEKGFAFYDFDVTNFIPASRADASEVSDSARKTAGETALKNDFRRALDEGFDRAAALPNPSSANARASLVDEMVYEGNLTFQLNGDLFDALIDSETRTFTAEQRPIVAPQGDDTVLPGQSLGVLFALIAAVAIAVLAIVLSSPSTTQSSVVDAADTVLIKSNTINTSYTDKDTTALLGDRSVLGLLMDVVKWRRV